MTKRSERIGAAAAKTVPPATTQVQTPATPTTAPATPAAKAAPIATSAQPSPKADEAIEMYLHRDCWDENGVRHNKGTVVSFSVETAKKLRKSGKAERFDPLLVDG